MTDIVQAIEIFALVTGIVYVILEILQKNAMWILGIFTSLACAFSFGAQHVWASMVLNIYYVIVSVFGFIQWRKASVAVGEGIIHLAPLPRKVLLWSAVTLVLGSLVLIQLLRLAGDAEPRLDAVVTVLSIIATWWLAQSYLQQWLLWVIADLLTSMLCLLTGQYWMAILYLAYTGSAVYGYLHWKYNGVMLEIPE